MDKFQIYIANQYKTQLFASNIKNYLTGIKITEYIIFYNFL